MEKIKFTVYKYLDIDTKRILGIPPGKIDQAKAWRLSYLLWSHDGLVYNLDSHSLHCFRNGMHSIRRPISLSSMGDWTAIFNDENTEHSIEYNSADGSYVFSPGHNQTIFTNLRVLLRGSGIVKTKIL